MRQIKFRGLRKDTGKWSYGYLVSVGADTMILPDTEQSYNLLKVQISVSPETVGQFTGLLDKNGKDIYEGDIIRYIGNEIGDEFTREVKFNDAGFDPVAAICWMSGIEEAGCEVIGNIHNNPKLLIQP